MMIGPMRKKVILSSVITAIILLIIFGVLAYFYISQSSKTISELRQKGEVVQRYVFTKSLSAGTVISDGDIKYVDVKGESAPTDSYEYRGKEVNGKNVTEVDQKGLILGKRLKVNVKERTIVTESLFYAEDKEPNMDTRLQEYNMVTLPSDLNVGDYIDVRIRFTTGEDYSVLIGKKIESFGATGSESNTIFLRLNEEEIVKMSSAIIESYLNDGINLYANKYVDPSNQLFDYSYIDLVAKYEDARYVENASENDIEFNESGEIVAKEPTKIERTDDELALMLGVDVAEIKNLKAAIESKNETQLNDFKNKLVTKEKSIEATYPVKIEVANLIKNNPNILATIREKYNVEALMEQRANLPDTSLTSKDLYTGEEKPNTERITKVKENLDKEITTQKTERQQYLMKLISSQTPDTSTDNNNSKK